MTAPLRILHFVSSLNRGGIECWLMNLLRLRRSDVHFDFVVRAPGAFDAEVQALGSTIHRPPHKYQITRYLNEIKRVLSSRHYDAVHCHITFMAGGVLKKADECGVPVRIVHSHNTGWGGMFSLKRTVLRPLYHLIDRPLIAKHATHLLACSHEAGASLFGTHWQKDGRGKVLYCGIPTNIYNTQQDSSKRINLCNKYKIPDDAIVIGSLGRLSYQKNHGFFLQIFKELARRDSRYILFIGGDGELRGELERQIDRLALRERVRLPGVCGDVPELLCQLFDVFVLPSRYEGLPVCVMEACAAGLHTICSDTITPDIFKYLGKTMTAVSLRSSPTVWCDAIEEGIGKRRPSSEGSAFVAQTPFNIERSMDHLVSIYRPEKT